MVRNPSFFTRSAIYPANWPTNASSSFGKSASGGTLLGLVANNLDSLSFQLFKSSIEGAQPIIPGWGFPASFTWGMCLDVAYLP